MEKCYCMLGLGGRFKQWIGIVTRTLRKRKLWIEKQYCMLGLGGKFKQWIGIVTRTPRKRKLWIENHYCVLGFGGKFKQWIGIVTRTLRKRKLWIEKYYCMLGLVGECTEWIGVVTRTLGKRRLWMEKFIACCALGGKFKQWIGIVTRTLRKRRLWMEKSIPCWAFGGKFKQWIGIVTRTLGKRKLRMEKFMACWAWGGKFKQWIGIVTRTPRKRKLWIENYYCVLGLGGEFQQPEKGDESQPLARIFLFPQRNVVVAAMIEVITPQRPLTIPHEQKPKPSAAPLEDFSLLCNPSPPLPQYNFSSPCKLSCSEPQRTLLSVELRSSSIFLRFPPALGDFPSFSVVFFLPFSCHSSIFLHLPPVFNEFPSFSLVFSSLFPAGVNGPRGESKPTVTSLRSGTCPPKKVQFARPPLQLISSFRATRDDHPPDPLIFTSFAKTTLPSLSAGFRNKQHL